MLSLSGRLKAAFFATSADCEQPAESDIPREEDTSSSRGRLTSIALPPDIQSPLSTNMMVELRAHIPELQRWQRWWRMYASTQSGLSWEAFFHSTRHEAPTLLVVQAMDGQIFGAFCTAPWEKQKGFYGSVDGGQCFLWRAVRDTVEVFHWQLVNRHFQMSDGTGLGIGGGGTDFGLYIADDLVKGTTASCATFANPPLLTSTSRDPSGYINFDIACIEVWGFTSAASEALARVETMKRVMKAKRWQSSLFGS